MNYLSLKEVVSSLDEFPSMKVEQVFISDEDLSILSSANTLEHCQNALISGVDLNGSSLLEILPEHHHGILPLLHLSSSDILLNQLEKWRDFMPDEGLGGWNYLRDLVKWYQVPRESFDLSNTDMFLDPFETMLGNRSATVARELYESPRIIIELKPRN